MKRKEAIGETIFNLLILGVFVFFFFGSLHFPPAAKSFPIIITIPAIVLAVWVVVRDFFKKENAEEDEVMAPEQRSKLHHMLLSFAGLIAAIILVGMPIGFAVFGFGFARFISRRTWLTSAVVGAFGFVLVWGLFGQLMHLLLYGGIFHILGN